MKVKLIAPFKTDFNVLYFNALRDYDAYLSFWDRVRVNYKDDHRINFLHTSKQDLIYEEIATDGNNFSPEVFSIKQDQILADLMKKANNKFKTNTNKYKISFDNSLDETTCYIYDNSVGIMETTIYIDNDIDQSDKQAWLTFITYIQEFSNKYMAFIIEGYYEKSLAKLIKGIRNLDQHNYIQTELLGEQLLNNENKKVKSDFFKPERKAKPLWVNRTLFIDTLENKPLIYNHWLALGKEDVQQIDDQIKQEGFYFGWGNNLVIDTPKEAALTSAIDAVNLCQYYNVVLEHTNQQITKLVGEIYSINGRGRIVKKIEAILEANIENANLLFMQLNEQSLNLQGHRKRYFEDLLFKWNINAIKKSIEKKIDFSKSKLDYFYRKNAKFSRTVSESILFGIGGIALVDFFASASHYSRILKATPEMGLVGDKTIGFIALGRILSPDGMIWTGVLILLFLFFVFIYVRRRS